MLSSLSSHLFFILLFLFFLGCSPKQKPIPPLTEWQEICGRDFLPTYRAKIPATWKRIAPPLDKTLSDTTQSLCEFLILEGEQQIRITLHNFPADTLEERIPPHAQIARWKLQFDNIDPASFSIASQAYAGFAGLLFEATGTLQNKEISIIGLSMQIAPEHFYQLLDGNHLNLDSAVQDAKAMQDFESESLLMGAEHSQRVKTAPIKSDYGSKDCVDLASSTAESRLKQMRADYTIKAVGPPKLMAQHKQAILEFAKSFELIEEIPSRS